MLTELFTKTLTDGLHRRTLKVPSIWAERCRIMGEPFPGPHSFRHHPWTKEMLNTNHEHCVGQKAAQMGYTETMLNRTFYTMDQLRRGVLYLLPNMHPDAGEFSQSRFDPALELSEHLSSLFTDVNKVSLKRSGGVCLYIRGSRSRAQLKSLPVALIVFDERDEMEQENVILAKERLSGQKEKQIWEISTPRVPSQGINEDYEKSSQEHFTFNCPFCSRHTELVFPDCIEITGDDPDDPQIMNSFLKCKECGHELPHADKEDFLKDGVWVPTHQNRMIRGFQINQLYSVTVQPYQIAVMYLRSLSNPAYEQEFYNSKLGLAHIVAGARITSEHVDACKGEHKNMQQRPQGPVTMGIDVGRFLHWRISTWKKDRESSDVNDGSLCKVIAFGKTERGEEAGFKEIDEIINRFRPNRGVIDAAPETRSSISFCNRFPMFSMCYYQENVKAKSLTFNREEKTVHVNRTAWLDQTLSRFRDERILLPLDVDREFIQHQSAQVRVYLKDKKGQDTSRYMGNGADHYAHAGVYDEVALKLLMNDGGGSSFVESPL